MHLNDCLLTSFTRSKCCLYPSFLVYSRMVVRLTSALLGHYVHSLAPSTSSILVCGKQLTVGTVQGPEVVVNKPLNPSVLCDLLRDTVFHVDPLQMSLQQELILYVASLLNKDKSLFKNIAVIRLGYVFC